MRGGVREYDWVVKELEGLKFGGKILFLRFLIRYFIVRYLR